MTTSVLRVYLRRSLNEEKQAASIDTQRAACERFARSRGFNWTNRTEYRDEDQPGDDFSRPGLVRLLSETKENDTILAYDDSRIGRDALECAYRYRQLLRGRSVRLFYALNEAEITANTGVDDVMNVVRGLPAQGELEKIRMRTRDALRVRKEGGYAWTAVPFGYRTVPLGTVDPQNPKGIKKKIEIDEDEMPIARQIFERYADGQGTQALARGLNRQGARSPRGRAWAPSTIWTILKNPFYRQGPPARPELAVIDGDLWARVASQMATRSRPWSTAAAKYALTGVLRCTCGAAMRSKVCFGRRPGWKRAYYVCVAHTRKGVCDNTQHYVAEVAERQIVGYILDRILPQIEARIRDEIRAEVARAAQARTVDLDQLRAEVARLKREQSRLAAAIAATDEPFPELLNRMGSNRELLRSLEASLRTASAPLDSAAAQEEAAVAIIERVRALLADHETLREALMLIFPSGLQVSLEEGGCSTGGPRRRGRRRLRSYAVGAAFSESLRCPSGLRNDSLDAIPVRIPIA